MPKITLSLLNQIDKLVRVTRLIQVSGFKNYRTITKRMERGTPELTAAESKKFEKPLLKLKQLLDFLQ